MKAKIATLILRVIGWRPVGQVHSSGAVIVCAPHTSNVDYLLMMLVAATRGMKLSFLGKASLFKPPLGILMRATGGIPVDRSAANGLVGQMVEAFERDPNMNLAVPAEGTRSRAEAWKSGFYRIAESAQVPITLAFIDKATKTSGFGPTFEPSGDIVADMALIREFYSGKVGLKPANFGPIQVREELSAGDSAEGDTAEGDS